MKQHIEQLIKAAIAQLRTSGELAVETPAIQIDGTKDKQHGDFACNIALILAEPFQIRPKQSGLTTLQCLLETQIFNLILQLVTTQ